MIYTQGYVCNSFLYFLIIILSDATNAIVSCDYVTDYFIVWGDDHSFNDVTLEICAIC